MESPSRPELQTPVQKLHAWHLHQAQWPTPPALLQNRSQLFLLTSPTMLEAQLEESTGPTCGPTCAGVLRVEKAPVEAPPALSAPLWVAAACSPDVVGVAGSAPPLAWQKPQSLHLHCDDVETTSIKQIRSCA